MGDHRRGLAGLPPGLQEPWGHVSSQNGSQGQGYGYSFCNCTFFFEHAIYSHDPKIKQLKKKKELRSSRCGVVETNLTHIHEDAGSIPDLTQWVEDPVLS